jgi:serine/threonine protein kinase
MISYSPEGGLVASRARRGVQIIDFGLARSMRSAKTLRVGTPDYMAPGEQRGDGMPDARMRLHEGTARAHSVHAAWATTLHAGQSVVADAWWASWTYTQRCWEAAACSRTWQRARSCSRTLYPRQWTCGRWECCCTCAWRGSTPSSASRRLTTSQPRCAMCWQATTTRCRPVRPFFLLSPGSRCALPSALLRPSSASNTIPPPSLRR